MDLKLESVLDKNKYKIERYDAHWMPIEIVVNIAN